MDEITSIEAKIESYKQESRTIENAINALQIRKYNYEEYTRKAEREGKPPSYTVTYKREILNIERQINDLRKKIDSSNKQSLNAQGNLKVYRSYRQRDQKPGGRGLGSSWRNAIRARGRR